MKRRIAAAAVAALFVVGCSDENTLVPNTDVVPDGPGFAIVDGTPGSGGFDGFWFLPPLAKQVQTEGSLDNELEPAMWVCELKPAQVFEADDGSDTFEDTGVPKLDDQGDPVRAYPDDPMDWDLLSCDEDLGPFTDFPAGSAELTPDVNYQFSWDTSYPEGPENLQEMDPERFYRIHVSVRDSVLGYFDVNPQRPSGESPGDDVDGLYAFRIGENLPVKVFITPQVRCATAEGYVIQCIAQGVIDQTGGVITLEPDAGEGWVTISTHVAPNSLPEGTGSVIVTMERIHPDRFTEQTGGEYCIPGLGGVLTSFDAPLFGDCLRITTIPELNSLLLTPAILEICITTPDVTEDQLRSMQIIRFNDDEPPVVQGLEMLEEGDPVYPTTCPTTEQFGLLPVPDDGAFHYAARAVNSVARWLGPQPLAAHGEISLGGLLSEFSRFRWGLPGEMVPVTPTETVIIQQDAPGVSYNLDVQLEVKDAGALDIILEPLQPEPVGGATVHFENGADVTTCYDADPDPLIYDWQGACADLPEVDGLAGTTWDLVADPDHVAEEIVPGSGVLHPSPGDYTFDAKALGLLSGPIPDLHDGAQTFEQATLTFYAKVVGLPSENLTSTALPGPVPPGHTYEDLVVTVTDANGDPVGGFQVTWVSDFQGCSSDDDPSCDEGSAVGQDGEVSGDLYTALDGTVTLDWTISTVPGLNELTVFVNGQSLVLFQAAEWTATGGCLVTVDGSMDDGEWDCATTETFTANVSGGSPDNAQVMWQTDGTDLYMLVRVKREREDKVNSLRIDFLNDPTDCANLTECDAAGGDDAIGFDFSDANFDGTAYLHFLDEYLTDRCANRSQSGCGSADTRNRDNPGTEDGYGAHQNGLYDGEYWNVYELSHPLDSGDPNDFARSVTEDLGFYLTLQVGNGAQGNTQWPGFRTYRVFTIQ